MKPVILLLLSFTLSTFAVSCIDGNGKEVDWFFVLKMGQSVKNTESGYAYAYFDSNSNGRYTIGTLHDPNNPVARTTQQLGLYTTDKLPADVGYMLYNDQTYDTFESKHATSHYSDANGHIFGHAKGFIGFDSSSSFWMIHSAPGFPYNHSMAPEHWYFPWSQTMFGQHFFCTSFKLEDVHTISQQIIYYYPFVYDHHIPDSKITAFPVLEKIIRGERESGHGNMEITSRGGATMKGTGKSSDSNSDLYEDWLAPALSESLKVITWCGGTFGYDCTPSFCKGQKIENPSTPQKSQSTYAWDVVLMDELYFGHDNIFNITWNHSKWAITYNSVTQKPQPWFCAADINRAISQRKRGGGALCIRNPELWNTLENYVIKTFDTVCEK